MNACHIALVDEFVQKLPQGYETLVNEDAGFFQAVSARRLLLRERSPASRELLILDEPTNHLDEESVRKLLDNLGQLRERPAILIITQNRTVAEGIARRYLLTMACSRPLKPQAMRWNLSSSQRPTERRHGKWQ